MNIITISREFGSGGRELGRKLADFLHADYFDSTIISTIAERQGLDRDYVEAYFDHPDHQAMPLTRFNSFAGIATFNQHSEILLEQKRVIQQIPNFSQNCVIVGSNADALLQEYSPFTIFVCATMETKIRRCLERQKPGENLTPKDVERKIHQIDKARRQNCDLIAGTTWGESQNYQMIVNTTGWTPDELVEPIANFARKWFEKIPDTGERPPSRER